MIVADMPAAALADRMRSDNGLCFRTGPFAVRLRTRIVAVREAVSQLYAAHPVLGAGEFCDFDLELLQVAGLRRWIRPQVVLKFDSQQVFEPLPLDHAFALFEWALNWCISTQAHTYLILHAAVVERNGRAAVLAAPPGSGKSTLCAGLVRRGWRLLSDELALISLSTGQLEGLARPVSLKNESEHVMRTFSPDAVFGRVARETSKGSVIHMRARSEDVARVDEPARPAWIIFPRFVRDAPAVLSARAKADAMMELGRNTFNYALLGRTGFDAMADLVTSSECFDFSYGRLEDAIEVFDRLASQAAA